MITGPAGRLARPRRSRGGGYTCRARVRSRRRSSSGGRASAASRRRRASSGRSLRRVEDALVAELRRRLGGAFTVDELAALYDAGTSLVPGRRDRLAPAAPWTWDARVADAAFARYVREAVDFAGGRRLEARP